MIKTSLLCLLQYVTSPVILYPTDVPLATFQSVIYSYCCDGMVCNFEGNRDRYPVVIALLELPPVKKIELVFLISSSRSWSRSRSWSWSWGPFLGLAFVGREFRIGPGLGFATIRIYIISFFQWDLLNLPHPSSPSITNQQKIHVCRSLITSTFFRNALNLIFWTKLNCHEQMLVWTKIMNVQNWKITLLHDFKQL